MYRFVTVKFKNSSGRYDYLCRLDDVKRGDLVRVMTPRGEQIVEVVKVFWSDGTNLELPLHKYKFILGKAEACDVEEIQAASSDFETEYTEIKSVKNFKELQELLEEKERSIKEGSKNEASTSKAMPKSPDIIRDLYVKNGSKLTDELLQKLYDEAQIYWEAKDWLEAEAAYNTILELAPNDRGSIKALATLSYFSKTRLGEPWVMREIGRVYCEVIEGGFVDEHMTKAEKEIEAFELIRNTTAFAAKETEALGHRFGNIINNKSRRDLENYLDVVVAGIEAMQMVGVTVLKYYGYNRMLKNYVGFCIDSFFPLYNGIYKLNNAGYTNRYHTDKEKKCLLNMQNIAYEYREGEAPFEKLYRVVKGWCGEKEPDPFDGWDKENQKLLQEDMKSKAMKNGLSKIPAFLRKVYASFDYVPSYRPVSTSKYGDVNSIYNNNIQNNTFTAKEEKKNDEIPIDELIQDPAHCWHPMNLFYDDDD